MPIKSDAQIVKQFKTHKRIDTGGLAKQYANTRECQMFYGGDLMAYQDSIQFTQMTGQKKRAMVQFNQVKPYVNAVKGFMAQNRRTVKYTARMDNEPLQVKYSEYANALKEYCRDQANADQVETQQNGDMLINGYGAVETAMTYSDGYASTDPNGQIIMGRLDPLMICWDSFAKATNLTDARRLFYQRDYEIEEAMDLFDDKDPEHYASTPNDGMDDDDSYTYYPRGGRYTKIKETPVEWSDEKNQMVKVYFYQWYEYENYYRADNPINNLKNPLSQQAAMAELEVIAQEANERASKDGELDLFAMEPRAEILTFDDKAKTQLEATFGKYIEIYTYRRKVFYSAVLSGGHVFTKFKNPCQQGFSVKFKTGDYDARQKIWLGMVNSMKDPVLYYNKALTELMFIIGAQSKGGVMVEQSAVEDIQKFEQQYAKTDAVITVSDGALSGGRIQDKTRPSVPSGYENIISLCDAAIPSVTGIDKTFLGSSENRQETGLLQSRRIKQVQSSLACYFDSETLYQKDQARLMLDLMRIWVQNNSGGVFGVIGENGKREYLKISEDKLVNEYDVSLEEASLSAEEKAEKSQLLVTMADKLLAVGDVATAKTIYSIAAKGIDLAIEDMQALLQVLVPQQQQVDPSYVQQLEQQLQMVTSEIAKAEVEKKISEIEKNAASVEKMKAETIRTLEDSQKIGIENELIAKQGFNSVNETQLRINA